MTKRSKERERFLADVLCCAIYHDGYGFTTARVFRLDEDNPGAAYAEVTDRYLEPGDEGYEEYIRVDIDTIAKGLGVIRRAVRGDDGELYTAEDPTQRLYYDGRNYRDLLEADRSNGEEGDVDVIGALAALECGLFGRVMYA